MMKTTARPTLISGSALSSMGLLLGLLALAGCKDGGPVARAPRVYAIDMNGKARACTAADADTSAGKATEATISMSNEGGWCGILTRQGGRPYTAGLVQTRPQHGMVHIHTVGDDTRVDFVPDAGFTGQDKFSVRLLPGNATLNVAVTVTPR